MTMEEPLSDSLAEDIAGTGKILLPSTVTFHSEVEMYSLALDPSIICSLIA